MTGADNAKLLDHPIYYQDWRIAKTYSSLEVPARLVVQVAVVKYNTLKISFQQNFIQGVFKYQGENSSTCLN